MVTHSHIDLPSQSLGDNITSPGLQARCAALQQWGGAPQLGAAEVLMWHMESFPQGRSSGTSLHFLDGCPDWSRLQHFVGWLCETTPRLRQRVVESALPGQLPQWQDDLRFDLAYHLRRVSLPDKGEMSELLQFLQTFASTPFDTARPPWEAILIAGYQGENSVFAMKIHHSLTDGGGLIQLFEAALSGDEKEYLKPAAARPLSPKGAGGVGQGSGLGLAFGSLAGALRHGNTFFKQGRRLAARVSDEDSWRDVIGYAQSLWRLNAPLVKGSALLRRRSLGTRYQLVDLPLGQFKGIAKALDASLNDVYLALCGGALDRYHRAFNIDCAEMPVAFPVSVRRPGDTTGGNRFTAINCALPVRNPDPAERIARIREIVSTARQEPALDFVNKVMPSLTVLPKRLLPSLLLPLTARLDIQLSNIPGMRRRAFLAGCRVLSHSVLPPRPGCAAMFAMISHEGNAGIAVNCDPAAIVEPELLVDAIREEFAALCQRFLEED